jgi:hypothetical protein
MCLVVGDSLLVVDAAVQGEVDAEGQESQGVLRSRYATSRSPFGSKGMSPTREVLNSRRSRPLSHMGHEAGRQAGAGKKIALRSANRQAEPGGCRWLSEWAGRLV